MIVIPILITITAVLSGIVLIVSLGKDYIDKEEKGLKKIKRQGYWVFIPIILLMFLPLLQYYFQGKADKKKDDDQKKEQDARDTRQKHDYDSSLKELKKSFDTSNEKTASIISDNLGKYGYKFDSAANRLVKIIKDSSKTKIIVGDDPVLAIADIPGIKSIDISERSNGHVKYKMQILSQDAGSCCFNIKVSYVGFDATKKYTYLFQAPLMDYDTRLAKESYVPNEFQVPDVFDMVFIWCRGNYKNIDKSKQFYMDQIYFYNIKSNTYGKIKGEWRKEIVSTISNSEK